MNTAKESSRPVGGDFLVVGYDHIFRMDSVFFTDIFDEEIINNESKSNGTPCMRPQCSSVLCLTISLFG